MLVCGRSALRDAQSLPSDLEFFIGRYDQDAHRRRIGRDTTDAALPPLVAFGVDLHSRKAEGFEGRRTDDGRVLADAGGEHRGVQAAELGGVGATSRSY